MNDNYSINDAIKMLQNDSSTFVAILPENKESTGRIYVSDKKGIAPIMDKLAADRNYFKGALVADRFLGKAAAMLLIASGAVTVYGQTISLHAQKVLQAKKEESAGGFDFSCGQTVPYIINRAGTGMCPMEHAVLDTDDPAMAYDILKEALAKMMQK